MISYIQNKFGKIIFTFLVIIPTRNGAKKAVKFPIVFATPQIIPENTPPISLKFTKQPEPY